MKNVSIRDFYKDIFDRSDSQLDYILDFKGNAELGHFNVFETEKFYLRIVSLSREMYEFYISLEKYIDEDGQISSLSYLPKVFSNVNNGLGVFAGYSQRYIEVKK